MPDQSPASLNAFHCSLPGTGAEIVAWELFGGRFKARARMDQYTLGEGRSGQAVGDWVGGTKVVSPLHFKQVPVVRMVAEG
ncbi:hypothetical protein COLO4_19300 [Corchorus olitorius]|uniref:Uncharacterized protein n=1 Tax=Corchorus olitorius TaxID=93759 RepID=A0A1R3J5Z3_9ROSI|nr:hypothetical protein COLO4_19300 [Corchorus olitorius]